MDKVYPKTHPWLSFTIDFRNAPPRLWCLAGECRSKCEHVKNSLIKPDQIPYMMQVYLAKGVQGSAAIEGNTISEQEVLDLVQGEESDFPESRAYQQQEIKNILKISNQIRTSILDPNSSNDLTFEMLCDWHRTLFDGLEVEDHNPRGAIPNVDIGVGRYKGAPRQECRYLLEKLFDWVNSRWSAAGQSTERWIDPMCAGIIKAIIAHLYFEWIHPFGDGNGRLGRLVEVFILLRAGVPVPAAQLLSNHYNLTRDQYYKELRDSTNKHEGNPISFLVYALRGFRDQLQEQIDFIYEQQYRTLAREYVYDKFRSKSRPNQRKRLLALALLSSRKPLTEDDLYVFNKGIVEQYRDLSERTFARDIEQLKSEGIVRETDSGHLEFNHYLFLQHLPPSLPEE